MKKPLTNYGDSVRARLLAIARRENVQLEYLLLRYGIERFLWRLGQSEYANTIVLKGASVFAVWLGPFYRVTRDADVEAVGDSSPETLISIFKAICSIECQTDAVTFDMDSFSTEDIKKEDKYPGVRIRFNACIGGARVPMLFDIGFGDSVYPAAEAMEYPTLLDGEKPHIKVYPVYSLIAEKFHAMVVRDILNSRLKDYYDIWLIAEHMELDRELLQTALQKTFKRRETELPTAIPPALTAEFFNHPGKNAQWSAFIRKLGSVEKPASLQEACERICDLLKPLLF